MASRSTQVAALTAALALALTGRASASHGPADRAATDPCNGRPGIFTVNNIVNDEVSLGVTNRHALLKASGHLFLILGNLPASVKSIDFKFGVADSDWGLHSGLNPAQRSAITAKEDATRDADSDLWLGNQALIPIPTDVVPDGNYVATLSALDAAGNELAKLCVDAIVDNDQSAAAAAASNLPAGSEASEVKGGFGYAPQPIVYRPAREPNGYASSYSDDELRIEFAEALTRVTVERKSGSGHAAVPLKSDDFRRPHSLAGGRTDGTPAESASERVWGPGYLADVPPGSTIRIVATDAAGKTYNSGEFKV